jgi:hypothetical protein
LHAELHDRRFIDGVSARVYNLTDAEIAELHRNCPDAAGGAPIVWRCGLIDAIILIS